MQNFRRFVLFGGYFAGGYLIYRLSRRWWWHFRNFRLPSVRSIFDVIPEYLVEDATSLCPAYDFWPLAEEQMLSNSEIEKENDFGIYDDYLHLASAVKRRNVKELLHSPA